MKIESSVIRIQKSAEDLFDFLKSPANFERLMPDDIASFTASEDGFKFALKGMPEVKLKKEEEIAPTRLVFGSAGSVSFQLIGEFTAVDDSQCDAQLLVTGDFNPMLRMMVERPLKSFISKIEEKLKTL